MNIAISLLIQIPSHRVYKTEPTDVFEAQCIANQKTNTYFKLLHLGKTLSYDDQFKEQQLLFKSSHPL